jgi:hypothetical protein
VLLQPSTLQVGDLHAHVPARSEAYSSISSVCFFLAHEENGQVNDPGLDQDTGVFFRRFNASAKHFFTPATVEISL